MCVVILESNGQGWGRNLVRPTTGPKDHGPTTGSEHLAFGQIRCYEGATAGARREVIQGPTAVRWRMVWRFRAQRRRVFLRPTVASPEAVSCLRAVCLPPPTVAGGTVARADRTSLLRPGGACR